VERSEPVRVLQACQNRKPNSDRYEDFAELLQMRDVIKTNFRFVLLTDAG